MKTAKKIHFRPQHGQKYAFYLKFHHIKVKDSMWYKKVSGRIYLSPTAVGGGRLQKLPSLKYYNVLKVATFEAPYPPPPGRDKHMRLLTFYTQLSP